MDSSLWRGFGVRWLGFFRLVLLVEGKFEAIPELTAIDATHGTGDAEDERDERPEADAKVDVGDVTELEKGDDEAEEEDLKHRPWFGMLDQARECDGSRKCLSKAQRRGHIEQAARENQWCNDRKENGEHGKDRAAFVDQGAGGLIEAELSVVSSGLHGQEGERMGEAGEDERGDRETCGTRERAGAVLKKDFAAVTTQRRVTFEKVWGWLKGIAKVACDLVVRIEAGPCEAVVMTFAQHERGNAEG